jgi:hypothetical protein
MNLFASSPDPVASAVALADRHVVKMAVETGQILWTALHLAVPDRVPEGGYRPTHRKHPCCLWAAGSRANFDWAVLHGRALCAEYQHRYGRVHASLAAIERAADSSFLMPEGELQPFALAMPPELKNPEDPCGSYRTYLTQKYETWGDAARWTSRARPDWLRKELGVRA